MKLFDICNDCNRPKSTLMEYCADCGSYKLDEWNVIVSHHCPELGMANNSLKKVKMEINRENFVWVYVFDGTIIKIKACIFCQRVLKHQLGINEENVDTMKEYYKIIKKLI